MTNAELLARLRQALTPAQWEALEEDRAPVSAFDRRTLLELRHASPVPEGEADGARAGGLYAALEAEGPYAALAGVYRCLLAGRPVHDPEERDIRVSGERCQCPRKSHLRGTPCQYCVCERMSNYEVTKRQMARAFAGYDQEEMIRRFRLESDGDYLYLRFLDRPYRVHRSSGAVSWSEDGFATSVEAGFNEAMTIYDVLCGQGDPGRTSGELAPLSRLMQAAGKPEQSGALTERQTRLFDHREEALRRACEALGGVPWGKGDVAYKLPLFDFLPAAVQFWNSDEEFPASLNLLWDRSILGFMHFETVWYAAGHLLERLEELAERGERQG